MYVDFDAKNNEFDSVSFSIYNNFIVKNYGPKLMLEFNYWRWIATLTEATLKFYASALDKWF